MKWELPPQAHTKNARHSPRHRGINCFINNWGISKWDKYTHYLYIIVISTCQKRALRLKKPKKRAFFMLYNMFLANNAYLCNVKRKKYRITRCLTAPETREHKPRRLWKKTWMRFWNCSTVSSAIRLWETVPCASYWMANFRNCLLSKHQLCKIVINA